MHFRFLIMSLFLSSVGLAQKSYETDGPTELWKKAEESNADLIEARARADAAVKIAQGSNGIFLPNVSMDTNLQKQELLEETKGTQSPGRAFEESHAYSVNLSQNIYNKEAWSLREKAQLNRDLDTTQLEVVESQVRRLIMELYWKVLYQAEGIALLQSALDGPLARLEAQATNAISFGIRSSSDLNAYLMQISTLKLQLLRLKADYDENLERLTLLVGQPIRPLRTRKPSYESAEIPQIPARMRPDLRIAAINVENANLDLDVATARFFPELAFNARYGTTATQLQQADTHVDISRHSSLLSLNLSIPLFNGFTDFRQRQASKALILAADARRDALEMNFKTRYASSSQRLTKALDRLKSALSLRNSSRDLEAAVLRRQDAGLASFDLLIGPRVQAVNMKLIQLESLYEFLTILANEYAEAGSLDQSAFESFERDVLQQ